jgi:hypothetical protein
MEQEGMEVREGSEVEQVGWVAVGSEVWVVVGIFAANQVSTGFCFRG